MSDERAQWLLGSVSNVIKTAQSWNWLLAKVEQSLYRPGQALRVPGGWDSRFQDNQHMNVVKLSALHTGRLYPLEIFLVLISVRGWVYPRTIVWLEVLCQLKIPVTPSGIEPATFRLVVQCFNQLHHRVRSCKFEVDIWKIWNCGQGSRGRSLSTYIYSVLGLGMRGALPPFP